MARPNGSGEKRKKWPCHSNPRSHMPWRQVAYAHGGMLPRRLPCRRSRRCRVGSFSPSEAFPYENLPRGGGGDSTRWPSHVSCRLPARLKATPTGGTPVRSRQAQGEVAAIERQDAGREVLETRRLRKRTRPRPVPRAGSGVEPAGRGPSPVQAAPVGDDQQHQG